MNLNTRLFIKTALFSILAAALLAAPDVSAEPSLSQTRARIASTRKDIADLAMQVEESKTAIASLNDKIEASQERLSRLTVEYARAEAEFREKSDAFNRRLVAIYKDKSETLSFLLGVRSFDDFLARVHYLSKIAVADRRLVDELSSRRAEAKQARDEARIENSALIMIRDALSMEREHLERLLNDASTRLEGLETLFEKEREKVARAIAARGVSRSLPLDTKPSLKTIPVAPYEEGFVGTSSMSSSFKSSGRIIRGVASWYGNEFHGRRTANGEIYNQDDFTAASRNLPFGTYLAVSFNGKRVIVRINDRGPFVSGRILDLSRGAAQVLGLSLGEVTAEVITPEEPPAL